MGVPAQVQPPAKKNLTERDEYFLEILMTEAGGDIVKAKKMAGYPATMPSTTVVRRLKEEIIEVVQMYMAQYSPQAINKLVAIVEGHCDDEPNLNLKLKAATEILDRVGIVKTLKQQVRHDHTGGVALMPSKNGYEN